MGSIALGSVLMSTTAPLRGIFEYMGNKMHGVSPAGSFGRAVVSCCNCYIACHDRFLRFLNRNAYIYMALSSEPFCSSSLNSFVLLLKNKSKFAFVDGIADMFMFLAKFFIATSTTCLSFAIMGWVT
jgi:solute carrier family 44 protein 1 (choline transporter-like protein)/choline transporter-like protein 2/4/5